MSYFTESWSTTRSAWQPTYGSPPPSLSPGGIRLGLDPAATDGPASHPLVSRVGVRPVVTTLRPRLVKGAAWSSTQPGNEGNARLHKRFSPGCNLAQAVLATMRTPKLAQAVLDGRST